MGMIGGGIRAISGPPKVSTISSVKNAAIGNANTNLLSDYTAGTAAGNQALADYTSRYMSGLPAATTRTGQEVGSIDQFYNGGMANQLAQLRTQRAKAMTDAATLAGQQAIASQNRSRVAGSGGMGSYTQRMLLGALTPIRVQAALDNANQERSDLGYVTQNQLGLAGQRQGMADKLAAYGLQPEQTRTAMLGARQGLLSGITNIDQANTFYGLQQKPNVLADVADSLDQGIMNAAAIYSSMGGGMGGMGGKKHGGLVRGPGTGTSDSIPTRLSAGEFVIPADVVDIPGVLPLLEKLRHMHRMHGVAKHQTALKERLKAEKGPGKSKGGMVRGYADGGLAGSAQQLGARAMADLTPTWGGPAFIPTGGAPVAPAMGFGAGAPRRGGMGMTDYTQDPFSAYAGARNAYFQPENFESLTPMWQSYGNYTSNLYNNPKSPKYIAPGTFE